MRNAPYIHPSHDSILELWQTFPIESSRAAQLHSWFSLGVAYKILVLIGPAQSRLSLCVHTHLVGTPTDAEANYEVLNPTR